MSVLIDDDFARIGGKSYAINKINSVEVRVTRPYTLSSAIVWGILAILAAIIWIGAIAAPEATAIGPFIVMLVFAALAWRSWKKSKLRLHHLFLMTSSSEAEALTSEDAGWIESLRQQIETAMLRHSRAGSGR